MKIEERWQRLHASFDVARRFLNLLTDRYLFPLRDGWFGSAAS